MTCLIGEVVTESGDGGGCTAALAKGATIDFDSTRPPSPFLTEAHHAWRRELRRFIDREIVPYVEEWEEAEEIPLSLYKKASEFGLLRMGYPERYGGISEGLDRFHGKRVGCAVVRRIDPAFTFSIDPFQVL